MSTATTNLAPVVANPTPNKNRVCGFLAAFKHTLEEKFDTLFGGGNNAAPVIAPVVVSAVPVASFDDAKAAIRAGKTTPVMDYYKYGGAPADVNAAIRAELFNTTDGQACLASDHNLAHCILANASETELKGLDLDSVFGPMKDEILAGSVLELAGANPLKTQRDPKAFQFLSDLIPADAWEDPKSGFGTRVCQQLWKTQGYDEICALITKGVDTSVAARADTAQGSGGGVYSGFVQPLQHIIQGALRAIDQIDRGETLSGLETARAEGARKIFKALEDSNTAITATKWSDVTGSEMIEAFKNKPGTIWGFEDIRLPYVQAAHETERGAQPLRMMEIWDAVEPVIRDAATFDKFLTEEARIDAAVEQGLQTIRDALKSDTPSKKFIDLKKSSKEDQEKFLQRFKEDAKAFLTEFVGQMPKSTFARPALGENGATDTSVSQLAGIVQGKLEGGLACKAGLWWAKKEEKPVYYCLDGIKIDDVINYKTVKNQAIQAYLSRSPTDTDTKGHEEVITMVELREILKNWDAMKGIVKFVEKGKLMSDSDMDAKVAAWKKDMDVADKAAGRAPAPPRATFSRELKNIDPALEGKLLLGSEGDKDARDLVRKSGYLEKVSRTRPDILLKYLISKCGVLIKYDLIPQSLVDAAKTFRDCLEAVPAMAEGDIKAAGHKVMVEIDHCAPLFRNALYKSLIEHPMTK